MDIYYNDTKVLSTNNLTERSLSYYIDEFNKYNIDFTLPFVCKATVVRTSPIPEDFLQHQNNILSVYPNLVYKINNKSRYFYDISITGTFQDIYSFLSFTEYKYYYDDLQRVLQTDGSFVYGVENGRHLNVNMEEVLILTYLKEENKFRDEHVTWDRLMGIRSDNLIPLLEEVCKRLYGIPLEHLKRFRPQEESRDMELSLNNIDDKLLQKVLKHIGDIL
jgi:hypothetical protein